MKKLMILAAMAAMFAGCSVTKVEYEQGDNGKVSYRLYRNSHWLKTEGEGMRGGMTSDGKFEFDLEGLKSSPSEEFNRTMMTYTSAFVQLAQIAAAAYNPSASAAIQSAAAKSAQSTNPPILQSIRLHRLQGRHLHHRHLHRRLMQRHHRLRQRLMQRQVTLTHSPTPSLTH